MTTNNTPSDEITLSHILRLALPLDTQFVACSSEAQRSVKWVVLLTGWEGLAAQVEAGDLVLLPPSLPQKLTLPQWKQKLSRFAELAVGGLLLFAPISQEIVAGAERLDLPILIAPETITVREANRAIAALLVDRQSATNERGLQLYRSLSEMSREEQGLQAMTDLVAKLTGKIVLVQDKRLEMKALSVPSQNQIELDPLLEALSRREELPPALRNRKAAARAPQSCWQQVLPIENVGRLVSPIISGDRARGYVSVIGSADKLDMMDTLAVEHAAAAFALDMARAKAVSEAKKELRGNFLEGLLAGTLPQKEIDRLAGRLDHDTTQPHAVLTFAWTGENQPSLRRLETAVNWMLANHRRPALLHIYAGEYVCVFAALKSADDMSSAAALGRRIQEAVQKEFPDASLVAGMSGPAETLADWPRVYMEAVQAMQLGERLQLGEVVAFSSLGVYQLLVQLEDIPAVRAFTDGVIGPLAAYDAKHNSSLALTMDAYFEHHGNISKTAESLFIHRNTLLYRLERIQDLTGHDLNQANMRLGLHLALKLWQLRSDKD
ncbi:MAG TPA: hypothetical protein ENK32_12820 [Anaerolineae bacterium]|nr:hypothetical protein [Anaerolineae bacterium]